MRHKRAQLLLVACALFAMGLHAESAQTKQVRDIGTEIDTAAAALTAAERAGAPVYAAELYNDAMSRLSVARANYDNKKSELRNDANLRAIEAIYAARAAEAKALWISAANEGRNLRGDIVRFGGTAPEMNLDVTTDDGAIDRGTTSASRVAYAEAVLARANAVAGGTAKADLQDAQGRLNTAHTIMKSRGNDSSVDHLAYVAEMIARRAEYRQRIADVEGLLPGLRLARTQGAEHYSQVQAEQERQRRIAAEQQAAALQQQLAQAEANRQAQAQELNALRQQNLDQQTAMQDQLARDRAARLAAEQQLDTLMNQYQAALGTATTQSDVDALRRQVEDQRLALQVREQQESQTEQDLRGQISRMQQSLDDAKSKGVIASDVLAQREAELTRQRADLDRMAQERQATEQQRAAADQARQQAINDAQQRIAKAEQEITSLRQQVAEEHTRNEQMTTQLNDQKMQQALAKIATTRSDSRGIIVTLPGIYFDTGKAALKPGARTALRRIADQLKGQGQISLSVEGHTDSTGSEEANRVLSEKRAAAVRAELVADGLSAGDISVVGRGEDEPIASNKTAAGRLQNRRVEVVIARGTSNSVASNH